MSTMFATMGSGKLVGLGAGGAVSSLVVYRRAESARDASTADRARGRRRAAEKQRLAEKAKEAASTRRDAGDDAGGSTRKAPAPAATAPAVAAAGTASAAPEKPVAPERRVGANPDDAAEETVVETEVDMRSRNADNISRSSPSARRAREEGAATRAGAALLPSSRAVENGAKRTRKSFREGKKTRTVAPIAAVAAPFGLLVARNLFRHVLSRMRLKKGAAAKTATKTPRDALRDASEPFLSLRAEAALKRAGATATTDANRLAELDKLIGFQAKELRFMRLKLAEKDERIAELTHNSAAVKSGEARARGAWRDDEEREMSRIEMNDDDAADLDATVDMTVDMTVDEVLRELAEETKQRMEEKKKRTASRPASVAAKGVPFAARGKENEEFSTKTRLAGRFLDDSDVDETPVSRRGALGARNVDTTRSRVSFMDPAVRVARGKSRVHRISPTRRQRETERAGGLAESSLRFVR